MNKQSELIISAREAIYLLSSVNRLLNQAEESNEVIAAKRLQHILNTLLGQQDRTPQHRVDYLA